MGWFGNAIESMGSGIEKGLGETWNFLRGDPNSVKAAYDQAMGQAAGYGQQSKDFLLGQQAKALQYYAPIQQLFNSTYGTGPGAGIKGPQVPMGPFGSAFGGR